LIVLLRFKDFVSDHEQRQGKFISANDCQRTAARFLSNLYARSVITIANQPSLLKIKIRPFGSAENQAAGTK